MKIHRQTVARIINEADFQDFIKSLTEQYVGAGEVAMKSLLEAIVNKKAPGDGHLAFKLLESIGVPPNTQVAGPRGKVIDVTPERTPEEGQARQAMMVASVLLESNKNFGIELPDGVEQMIKDAEAARAKKT
jgi:hypothetical protein